MKKYFLIFISLLTLNISCNSDDDAPEVDKKDDNTESKVKEDYPSQDFMWQAMNAFYFWQDDVENLQDDKFDTLNKYVDFLASENNPETFFYNLCNQHIRVVGEEGNPVDRFSWAVENYKDLVNNLQGVSKSNGLEFNLYAFSEGNNIYGVVRYVAAGSDASTKDIKRGDLFVGVNGTTLTRDNYIDLLFGDNDTYTLDMASVSNNILSENGKEVSLTKIEDFSENPILVSKVIEENGIKIGYLMYNSFLAAYDEQLNDAFGTFKTEGVTELVLDFRYNGGGRVSTSVQIASTVYGTNTDELFLKARYNSKIQATLNAGDGETKFSKTTIEGSPINALNLKRVHVITTYDTASASELVINGLVPYVDVVVIGEKTRGKNEFSITFVDDVENNYFYDKTRENKINPNNQWGIQPLLGRNENADGFSDYTKGIAPNFILEEDIGNLGVLGNPSEPLLALAISNITGNSAKRANYQSTIIGEPFTSSTQFKPTTNLAVMDGLLKFDLKKTNSNK